MPDNTDAANTSWKDANDSCLKFLANVVGAKVKTNAFLGDDLPETVVGAFAFLISSGPEQTQNYQCPTPARKWLGDGVLFGQYETMEDAFKVEGKIRNSIPAQKGGPGDLIPERGLPPNVGVFEMTLHPQLNSREQVLTSGDTVTIWLLRLFFRVVYYNNKP